MATLAKYPSYPGVQYIELAKLVFLKGGQNCLLKFMSSALIRISVDTAMDTCSVDFMLSFHLTCIRLSLHSQAHDVQPSFTDHTLMGIIHMHVLRFPIGWVPLVTHVVHGVGKVLQ